MFKSVNHSTPLAQSITAPRLKLPSGQLKRPKFKQRQIEQWANELPIGNTTVAAHQMLDKLKALNEARYSYKERLQIHNSLRPVFNELLHAIRTPLRQANLPMDQQHLYRAQLMQDLLDQMAMGYKHVASELCLLPRLKEYDQFLLTESIYMAIIYLGQRLVDSYGVYAPEPETVWQDLNQLYRYATARQLHSQQIDDVMPDTPLPVALTIDFAYKRILLLSLAEPYHLMQYEADDMFRLIASMVESCVVEPFQEIVTRGEYVLDLDSDHGPRYMESDHQESFSDPRIIEITAVKNQLNTHIQRLLASNAQQAEFEAVSLVERQQRDMLLRLADAWDASLVRKNPRFDLAAKVEVTAGLNAAHYYISEGNSFTPEMDELRLVNNLDIDNTKNDSVIAIAYRDAIQKDRKHDNQSYSLNPWAQRNISPIGIAINCPIGQGTLDIRVGELITYRVIGKKLSRWQIGVTRWLKHEFHEAGAGNVHAGIMNLANGAIPVGTKAITGLGNGTDYFRSLMIPKQVSLQQTRSLIVPALLYDVGTVITVNLRQRIFYARLTRMVLSTRSFTQFDFEVIKRPMEFEL